MTRSAAIVLAGAICLALAGCYSPAVDLPRGEQAYARVPAMDVDRAPAVYRIGPLDVLSVRVFQEPDLSFESLQVDAAGNINFPLVGTMRAAGKDPLTLSRELRRSLASRFIREPQVVVGVEQAAGQRFVVEGSVNEPGSFEIAGRATLLESIARAKGLTRMAQNDKVAIFRQIDGQRAGALFNVNDIREGKAPDPEVLGGDTIVVGFSAIKGAYRDFLATAPLINLFRTF